VEALRDQMTDAWAANEDKAPSQVEAEQGTEGDDLLTAVRADMAASMMMWDNASAAHRPEVEAAREAYRAEPIDWLRGCTRIKPLLCLGFGYEAA
jgi:hypothetical protein